MFLYVVSAFHMPAAPVVPRGDTGAAEVSVEDEVGLAAALITRVSFSLILPPPPINDQEKKEVSNLNQLCASRKSNQKRQKQQITFQSIK